MGTKTGIEWTDHTFNPWIGCTKVSAGCANCYAKTRDDRHMLGPVSHWGPGAPRHITSAANWREPIKWAKVARAARRRDKVFCASQADIFELEAPVAARQALWRLIGDTCDALDWQILTKRPENILSVMCDDNLNLGFFELTRCWLGVSVENQAAADERIPLLLQTPAAVRFISAEPLLGPVDLTEIRYQDEDVECEWNALTAFHQVLNTTSMDAVATADDGVTKFDWVICGGESGPGARPMHPDWARSLRDQCKAANVPFFFKQWGEWGPNRIWHIHSQEKAGQLIPMTTICSSPKSEEGKVSYWAYPSAVGEAAMAVIDRMVKVGKKTAGSLLDGVEHKKFPVVRP